MNLAEKYRPQTWEDVVGQDRLVAGLLRLRDTTGLGGESFWLAGKSGTGKTTIARLIAQEVAEHPICVTEIDADDLTPALIAEIKRNLQIRLPRAWIINEAHGLNKTRARKLLTVLDPPDGLPSFVVFVFTTTLDGQQTLFDGIDDAGPLLSRCHRPKMEHNLTKAFAKRAQQIAQAENLDGRPLSYYMERVKQNRNNLRAVIQEIQEGRMMP